jgi:hypothetical protein
MRSDGTLARRDRLILGCPRPCPHSLRGLHATLALEAGATSELVARALGHGSFEITARHYASPDSVANARALRVLKTLTAPPPPKAPLDVEQLVAALSSLPADTLDEIIARVHLDRFKK